jgi:hypothetical protein
MAENFYNPFPKDTPVFCLRNGIGKVYKVDEGAKYPIKVRFLEACEDSYTLEGKLYEHDCTPMLYKDRMDVIKSQNNTAWQHLTQIL